MCRQPHPLNTYTVQVELRPSTASSMTDIAMDLVYQGSDHWLAVGESVDCDGIRLGTEPDSSTLYGTVATQAVGGAYRCTFTSQGKSASMVIPVLPPPILIAPAAQSTLARADKFTISYAPPSGGAAITEVDVEAYSADPLSFMNSAPGRPAQRPLWSTPKAMYVRSCPAWARSTSLTR